jgi:hypothetical protein
MYRWVGAAPFAFKGAGVDVLFSPMKTVRHPLKRFYGRRDLLFCRLPRVRQPRTSFALFVCIATIYLHTSNHMCYHSSCLAVLFPHSPPFVPVISLESALANRCTQST